MDVFSNHIFSWLFCILAIFSLIYTMIVIKEENTAYLENANQIKIDPIIFNIPSWWNIKNINKFEYSFTRREEQYDWNGTLKIITNKESLIENLQQTIKSLKIKLDQQHSIIQKQKTLMKKFKLPLNDILHIESTGTQNQEKRIYLSIYLLKITENKIIVASSLSSVLDGGVEGPYFEEMLFNSYTNYLNQN